MDEQAAVVHEERLGLPPMTNAVSSGVDYGVRLSFECDFHGNREGVGIEPNLGDQPRFALLSYYPPKARLLTFAPFQPQRALPAKE